MRSISGPAASRTARAIATFRAKFKTPVHLVVAGGVAANSALRARLADLATAEKISLHTPPLSLCTDNAAMIGAAAAFTPVIAWPEFVGEDAIATAPPGGIAA